MKKAMASVVVVWMILGAIQFYGCGSSGGDDEALDDGDTTEPAPVVIYSNSDTDPLIFRAFCNTCFDIVHSGSLSYRFNLLYQHTQQPTAILAVGEGDFNGQICLDLATDDYTLEVISSETWQVALSGCVQIYDTGSPDSDNDINTEDCNCGGCCSHHGGVECINGVTQCADGSALSAKCKDCIAKGCPGCDDDNSEPVENIPTYCTNYSAVIKWNTSKGHGGPENRLGCTSEGRILCEGGNFVSKTTCKCNE